MINPEQSIVALCIKYPDMIPVIRTSIMGKMFTNSKYGSIYKACLKLKDNKFSLFLPTSLLPDIQILKILSEG